MRAQDLCEAEAETASAVDAGRSRKAKEEVDLFFRFQGSFCHLERVRVGLCPEELSVISASLATLRERVVRMVISFNFRWKFERGSTEVPI